MSSASDFAIHRLSALRGALRVPGDKGISHRAILLGAGVEGRVMIQGLSPAGDVASSLHAIQVLGIGQLSTSDNLQVESSGPSSSASDFLELEGTSGWQALEGHRAVDCENSGTTMRLLMGIAAGRPAHVTLHGDDSLTRRPMLRVADPLRRMGATIDLAEDNRPPVVVHGGQLHGIDFEPAVASAQVKTAVLLAGLQASGRTTVRERAPTRDHTERLLSWLGADVQAEDERVSVEPTRLFGDKVIHIPGDFSSASFLLTGAAILESSDVTLLDLGLNPTRTGFLTILERFGAEVQIDDLHEQSGEPRGTVRVRPGDRRPVVVDADEGSIDELPLVGVLGCFADGTTEVRGAGELRVKESDRIATITEGLRRLGADIEPRPDGFAVHGPCKLTGARVRSAGDHRIAMALAVAGAVADGETVVEGWDAVAVSYPGFEKDLLRLAAGGRNDALPATRDEMDRDGMRGRASGKRPDQARGET